MIKGRSTREVRLAALGACVVVHVCSGGDGRQAGMLPVLNLDTDLGNVPRHTAEASNIVTPWSAGFLIVLH